MTDPNHLLPQIWEAQTKTLAMKNTGMAVTTDITNLDDIHPRNKQDVGKRLALWAMAKTYGKEGLVYSGPLYKSMKVEGNKVRIEFDHIGAGLKSRDGKPLSWFSIAGKEGDFVDATAAIDGNSIIVSSDKRRRASCFSIPNVAIASQFKNRESAVNGHSRSSSFCWHKSFSYRRARSLGP